MKSDDEELSPAAKAAHERAARRRKQAARGKQDSISSDFRPKGEDDDGYDPYSDYMDQLARSEYEEPSADPWR